MAVIVLVWAQGICISRQPVEISPGQADLVQLQEKKKTKSEKKIGKFHLHIFFTLFLGYENIYMTGPEENTLTSHKYISSTSKLSTKHKSPSTFYYNSWVIKE